MNVVTLQNKMPGTFILREFNNYGYLVVKCTLFTVKFVRLYGKDYLTFFVVVDRLTLLKYHWKLEGN